MRRIALILLLALPLFAETKTYRLNSLDGVQLLNAKADVVTYRGKKALRIIENPPADAQQGFETLAILTGSDFKDGVIEAEIAGVPATGADALARGFVGIAFRVQSDPSKYECFYIRPTNGRANDQLRRNHSTQYISHPDWPWFRLRKEVPGVYESYTDLVPGEWTKIRIEVSGVTARLFVNGAPQPCLIVNDLKHGESQGRIALWIGQGTEAHFSGLVVK